MDFGKVDNIDEVDFTLPNDHPTTDRMLSGLHSDRKSDFSFHLGCAKWGLKEWAGLLYPEGTLEKDFLKYYVQQFNCIELNALFYGLPQKSLIKRWVNIAGEGFRFCPKFSNSISHVRQLKFCGWATDLFVDHALAFGEKLGHSFLQLSDRFGIDRFPDLRGYLSSLPANFKTCVELRHAAWFRNSPEADEIFQLMNSLGIATVITDTPGRRDCLHMRLTTPTAFIRFAGNNVADSDRSRIDAWAGRIKSWIGWGIEEVYFYVHNHDGRYLLELCKYVIEKFNSECGAGLKPLRLTENKVIKNGKLF
ncbi:MAG: DUF72 domain-containing protein [Chitinophagales bacterium]